MAYENMIKISELPESMSLGNGDYFVIEKPDMRDTYRIKGKIFYDHLKTITSDLSESVNDKIIECNQTIQATLDAEAARRVVFNEWTEIETQRQVDEQQRITNENERTRIWNEEWTPFYDATVVRENIRIDNENTRIATENIRIETENERIRKENIRIETENERIRKENIRIENEDIRKANEQYREEKFAEMVAYFDKVKAAVISRATSGNSLPINTNNVATLAEITWDAPMVDKGEYNMFFWVGEYNVTQNKYVRSGIYSLNIRFVSTGNDVITLKSLDDNTITDIQAIEYIDGGSRTVRVKCTGSTGNIIETNRITDTMTKFNLEHFWSGLIRDITLEGSMKITSNATATLPTIVKDIGDMGYAASFGDTMEALYHRMYTYKNKIDAMRSVDHFPVGAIYDSIDPTNPADYLGGGVWELKYGEPVTMDLRDNDGTLIKSRTLYEWVRIR